MCHNISPLCPGGRWGFHLTDAKVRAKGWVYVAWGRVGVVGGKGFSTKPLGIAMICKQFCLPYFKVISTNGVLVDTNGLKNSCAACVFKL